MPSGGGRPRARPAGGGGGMREHMRTPVDQFGVAGRWQLPLALLVVGVLGAAVALTWTRRAAGQRVVATVAAFTLALTVLTLALTAYWDHHLQMLAYPAALIAATLVSVAAGMFGSRAAVAVAAVTITFALWSSLKNEDPLQVSRAWTSTPISAGADALEKARARYYPSSETVPYMVFGGNSENGHAAFLDEEFELTCRWFHLAPISLDWQFEETLECARRERPLLVLISLGFFDERQRLYPRWGGFVRGARRFLTADYEKVGEEHP